MAAEDNELSKRVKRLAGRMLTPPSLCVERAWLVTESYKETESVPPVLRRAKALSNVLRKMTLRIDEDELLVGSATSKQRGAALFPEINAQWLLEEMDRLSTRPWDRFGPPTKNERTKIKEILAYWRGKSFFDVFRARIPEGRDKLLYNGVAGGIVFCANGAYMGHTAVDYEKVLAKGLCAVKAEVDDELSRVTLSTGNDLEKFHFLKAAGIVLDAVPEFSARYAELADAMAKKRIGPERKAELKTIAQTCRQVPGGSARTFVEALQSIYFVWIALMVEGWSTGMSFGRADQYLYPYYQKDLAEGRITEDEARSLISLFYIKINSTVTVLDRLTTMVFSGFPQTVNITLGGLTRDGYDAVNDLSYLFLEADKAVGLSQNDLIIRIHKNTPEAFVMKACEVAKALKGKLKFLSDETSIQQFLNDGYPIEYARDYIITGCNSPSVPGRSFDISGGMFNLPLMLELALNNGVSRLSGERIGPETGDPATFSSYDEVLQAYKRQVEALLPAALFLKNVDRDIYGQLGPTPLQSSLFQGCIEKGLDMAAGGTAPYTRQAISVAGAPNVGDALAAIKKVVFQENKITMKRLIEALERNFEGEAEVLHLLEKAPKFGNDDDFVDSIVNDVLMHARDLAVKHEGSCRTRFNVSACAVTANVPFGFMLGALPDGRKAGQPLSEGGISPHQGRNVSGPTSTLRSVAKLDHVKLTNGSVLNMKFNPGALKDHESMKKFASLIRTFCETGGFLVQFNIIDVDTMRAAQKKPEQYRDLLVRVATYSAYFVELSPELQNDVIRRIEFQTL